MKARVSDRRGRAPIGIRLAALLVGLATLVRCGTARPASTVPYTDLANERRVEEIKAQLRANPDNLGARYRLVLIYLEEFMFVRAHRELDEIIRRAPEEAKAYELLALVQARGPENDPAAAVATLKAASSKFPQRSSVHANLALRYLDEGQVTPAEEEAKTAAVLAVEDPGDRAVAYLILAGICQLRGRSADGERFYRQAKEADPQISIAAEGTAHFPMAAGDLAPYGKALSSHPASLDRARRIDQMLRSADPKEENPEERKP
jgi:Tfp pilus assembly protein PilF